MKRYWEEQKYFKCLMFYQTTDFFSYLLLVYRYVDCYINIKSRTDPTEDWSMKHGEHCVWGTANWPGECQIQFTLLFQLCDNVTSIVLVLCASVRKADLFGYILWIQNIFDLFNSCSIRGVMINYI